jgi:hypothetical protein
MATYSWATRQITGFFGFADAKLFGVGIPDVEISLPDQGAQKY